MNGALPEARTRLQTMLTVTGSDAALFQTFMRSADAGLRAVREIIDLSLFAIE